MTLVPKSYQEQALEALHAFLQRTGEVGAATAYGEVLEAWGRKVEHYIEVPGFPGLPYVCLRIPTGGGKTLLAAHAIGLITDTLLRSDTSLTLWLAPTSQIVDQTLTALRDRHHPLRLSLEEKLGGRPVEVLDVGEALSLSRGMVTSGSVVIVSTLQALRVGDTKGRKVYESNGTLQHHFTGLDPADRARLEHTPSGTLLYSLANVIKLHRPIVIMDEAHNARTPLSFETLTRFDPSMVLELTATPNLEHKPAQNLFASNVLYSVSAYQLKAEGMIKLPLLLTTHADRLEVIGQAIARRDALEATARKEQSITGEAIRPIVLYQAQSDLADDPLRLTPQRLKTTLMNDFQVPEREIAIATGDLNELQGVDLNAPDCPIRHIITVQALREGWDCPFAYVLCSVGNAASETAVEQLVGRVLRLPRAKFKNLADLNHSYAYVTSPAFAPVMETLQKGLKANGFEADTRGLILDSSLFPDSTNRPSQPTPLYRTPTVVVTTPPNLAALPEPLRHRFEYDEQRQEVRFTGAQMTEEDRDALRTMLPPEQQATADRVFESFRAAPSERGAPFAVPRLTVRRGAERLPFERSLYLDGPWPLSTYDARLSEADFSLNAAAGIATQLDVTEAGKLEAQFVSRVEQQLLRLVDRQDWTPAKLAVWLDKNIPHPDVTPREASVFLLRAVEELLADRRVDVNTLAREKYRLREALARRIEGHRQAAKHRGFEALLGAELVVDDTPDFAFRFGPDYPFTWAYEGTYRFQKHYYPVVGELKSEGEEYGCATFIDTLPEVKYWVRNLERQPRTSFWLPTSTDRFYPDFVALLHADEKRGVPERILVVEYKGGDRITNDDSKEKRRIGEMWAARSGGQALFALVGKDEVGRLSQLIRQQLGH
ncbi:type III restriction enzyme [Deinococcus sp. HSC-46F16]|uniref:DEAD/DEAH box helicase n=1 Tax=Deinococcus sp. HSC-46F16 TaxID=2910968 RepID=UPI0020A04CE2|nr:DEAD/DEAH box helicase family protein [Deinococcus sp. HSC-46F16]MCP2013411.1 type III restriction enzyme [Deinococcus sp. HSC-46F16]